MKIKIVSASKLKDSELEDLEQRYWKRVRQFAPLDLVELERRGKVPADAERAQDHFDQKLLTSLSDNDFLVLLDESGEQLDSRGFARVLEDRMISGGGSLVFAIGGAYGWGDVAKRRAKMMLSLSKLTFPYGLCRVILAEQLYRGFSLVRGLPYHK